MHYASFPLPKRDLDVEGFLSTASPGLEFPAATSAGARRLLCVYSVPSSPIKASFIICYEKEALCFGLRCFSFLFLSFLFFKAAVNKLMGQVGGEAGLKNYSWEKVSVIGFGSQNGFRLPDTKPSSMH